jgi:hypothetical protein
MTPGWLRAVLPWVLLGAAGTVAMGVVPGRAKTVSEPTAAAIARSESSAGAGAGPMTAGELRDFHVRLSHEQCEDGAKHLNVLEGREPTDRRGLLPLSTCLNIGNLAWYKCLVRASAAGDAHACTRRFLSPDNPP